MLGGLHSVPSAHWVHIRFYPSFQVHYKLPLHPCHICNRLIVLVHHIVLPMPEHFTSIHSVPPRRPPPRSPSAEQAGPCFPGCYCLLILNLRQVVKIRVQLTRRGDLQYHSLKRNLGLDLGPPRLLALFAFASAVTVKFPTSGFEESRPCPRMSRCGRGHEGLHYSGSLTLSLCLLHRV